MFRGGRGGDRGGGRGGRGDRGRGRGDRGGRGGRGRGRGRGRGGPAQITPFLKHEGIFMYKGKTDFSLATLNSVPGISVYGEKRIPVETDGEKKEYRVWNPFRSKLAAALAGGIDHCPVKPGTKVLYLGAASGTTVSHVSDVVGENGVVYAVEFAPRSGRDLVEMAKRRRNVVPIVSDARTPAKYRMLVGTVDAIFMDVAQPDQARIMALNAAMFLKTDGMYMISIKANCIDSTMEAPVVFANEVEKLRKDGLKPMEQITLEPWERDHAVVVGVYRTTVSKPS